MEDDPLRDLDIFDAAPEGATEHELEAYLDEACGADSQLRRRVESLFEAEKADRDRLREGPVERSVGDGPASPQEGEGSVIGNYRLVREIGEGGFGTVYQVEQLRPVKREVALKIIKLGMDTRQVVARFEVERQALAVMDHPGIARVFDAGATESGRPYFVMELVRGMPVTQFCNEQRQTTRRRIELFCRICDAVQHAHQKGVIHRDLKPANVLVAVQNEDTVPKVIDFGVAKAMQSDLTDRTLLTRLDQPIGTPAYMSPEQMQSVGSDIDTRSDVYALGVLLYELLTGRVPFDSKALAKAGPDEIRRLVLEEEPPKPSTRVDALKNADIAELAKRHGTSASSLRSQFRGELDWIVMKAMDKVRDRRYESSSALAADLRRYLRNEPVLAAAPGIAYRMQKFARRNRVALATVGAIGIVLVAATIVSVSMAVRLRSEVLQRTIAEKKAIENARRIAYQLADPAQRNDRSDIGLIHLAKFIRDDPASAFSRIAAERLMFAMRTRDVAVEVMDPLPNRISDVSHDGSKLLTVSVSEVQVWDLKTRSRIGSPISGGAGLFQEATFSPDGTRVLTRAGSGAFSPSESRVWDWQEGTPVTPPLQHPTQTNFALFGPKGRRILTGANRGYCSIWDAETGEETPILRQNEESMACTSGGFSPDGQSVVVAQSNGSASIWSAETGERVGREMQHGSPLRCVRFSPDGKRLVTASSGGTARLWSVEDQKPHGAMLFHEDKVVHASFSPDGRLVVTTSEDSTARIWNVSDARLVGKPLRLTGKGRWTRFSSNGQTLLTSSDRGDVQLWSVATREPIGAPLGHGWYVQFGGFTPDGSLLYTSSEDEIGHLWEVRPSQPICQLFRHEIDPYARFESSAVKCASFSGDGTKLVSAASDPLLRIWDTRSGEPLEPLPGIDHYGRPKWIAFSRDGSRIASASNALGPRVWQANGRVRCARILDH